jgi:NAD(P)-dependent dehydrogenase (short-subunit alcohol dehydrogenase family)
MSNASDIERAIAIRMTCSDPELNGKPGAPPVIVSLADTEDARSLAREPGALARKTEPLGLGRGCHVPAGMPAAEIAEAVASAIRKNGAAPRAVAVQEEGIYVTGSSGPEAAHVRNLLLGSAAPAAGASRESRPLRLGGCVTVVTGSAQGFGQGIAEELAREGACVVVADLNDKLGAAFAAELNERHGQGTAIFCRADVTSLSSLDACMAACVKAFGGVDLFVANAGILKAGAIDEMDEKSFDLVTSVNYKAYFLCVKSAAAVMKMQHRFNPRHFMDIVQINSKSGLEGSKKNFAYAGSKFGGIGLTQSFALELVPYHIKVNAICPGNFFEGPLWSDPERGLFVQYLKAGKVEGARTVADVKRFYVAKVPMNRGCMPKDVARAIFYLREQEYETGQALPVTGGQVMLS